MQVILSDSAGLRQTLCPIEAEGVRRAVAAAAQAQIVLHVADAADEGAAGEEGAPEQVLAEHAVHLRVLNKADLLPGAEAAAASGQAGAASAPAAVAAAVAAGDGGAAAGGSGTATGAPPARRRDEEPSGFARPMPLLISCKSGQGVDTLLAALRRQVLALVEAGGGDGGLAGALVTRTRHRCAGRVNGKGVHTEGPGCCPRAPQRASGTRLHAKVVEAFMCFSLPHPGTTWARRWRRWRAMKPSPDASWS